MKAFVKLSQTSNEISFVDVEIPEINSHELLVKIHAVGVGVHDEYFLPPNANYPYVIGIEAAGIIEKVGSDVLSFEEGTRIAFVSAMQLKGGTWAEYAVVSANSLIVPIPDTLSFEEAASLPVPANTILKAFHATNLEHGGTLFISGGSGAIGTLAIQIAVSRGYKVAASSSVKNHDYMISLGAEKVIDYHESGWQEDIKNWSNGGVDTAIAIQPGTATECEGAVRDGGVIVTISGDQFTPERGIDLHQIPHGVDVKKELEDLVSKVAAGDIQITIEKIYPFKEALEALEKVKTRHTRGKLVLTLAEE